MRRHPDDHRHGAGRWFSRALLVFGGTVAGTAAAWALSTSAASAATLDDVDPLGEARAVAEHTVDGVKDVADGMSDALEHGFATSGQTEQHAADGAADDSTSTDGANSDAADGANTEATSAESSENTSEPIAAARQLPDTVVTVADKAVLRPATRTVGTVLNMLSHPSEAPGMIRDALTPSQQVSDFGKQVWNYFTPGDEDGSPLLDTPQISVGDLPTVEPTPGEASTPSDTTASQAHPRSADADAPNQRAPNVLTQRTHPVHTGGYHQSGDTAPQSPAPTPFAPLALPSVPSGTTTGGHLDSPQFGYANMSLSAFDSAAIGAVRSGIRSVPSQPESQPGVTPD